MTRISYEDAPIGATTCTSCTLRADRTGVIEFCTNCHIPATNNKETQDT